ncbi:uncharacterized protein PV09_03594 [Verruconis gallopava]|uniref:Heterokaryon incompatibility domain-containing protein n=1 Tax=Verruconis gallopava TaxID=253628 RepID=A0A0D1YYF1_9PEZI|nr:uncharacterized protein PV09_03594 [Verruconis gallopava]KIW05737.1 hypothetical protein PV09_03594 [Verruconis gallopava]
MRTVENDYVYDPVDSAGGQIRLLSLKFVFRKRPDTLEGTMKSYYLPLSTLSRSQRIKRMAALPSFEALSYVWGDPTLSHNIVVDGKKIAITENLFKALSDMQMSAVHDILVWSDAVCICQQDSAEGSGQVMLMREIYQAASSVYIWLDISPSDTERQICFKVVSTLTGNMVLSSWEEGSEAEPERQDRSTGEKIFKPISWAIRAGVGFGQAMVELGEVIEETSDERAEIMTLDDSWTLCKKIITKLDGWQPRSRRLKKVSEEDMALAANQIDKLISQDWSWFERIWVMQELGASGNPWVVAAGASLEWQEFLEAAWYLSKRNKAHIPQRSRVALIELELIRRGFSENKRQSLYNLIRACRYRQATDPRDKIFALLGLMGDKMSPHLTPNYNIDVREVYARATIHIISQHRMLDPICGWQTAGRMEGLPSWTPDYLLNQDLAVHPIDSLHTDEKLFNAAGADYRGIYDYFDSEPRLETWSQLPVKGLVVDIIGSGSCSFPEASASDIITLWLSAIRTSSELSRIRTDTDVIKLEELAQLSIRYAQHSRSPDLLLNILAPRGSPLPYNHFQTNLVDSFDESYLVTAFANCLFTGHILGNRLKPSDIQIMRNLDPQLATGEAEEDIVNTISSSLKFGVEGRNIVFSKRGYIGTAREDVVAGDLICVLFGCSVPVILRKLDADEQYAFMGEAYVHGLMDAEAIVMQIKGQLKERNFLLC